MRECSTVSFENQTIFIGIDVHKKSWTVNLRHCCRELDRFSMNPSPDELAAHLKKKYTGATYRSVYEAGFSGFQAHRHLCALGIMNIVINPADVPTTGREHNGKNDNMDSRKLARMLELGALEAIHVPAEENLMLRDLVRRETQLARNIARAKNRVKSHLDWQGAKFMGWSGCAMEAMRQDAEKRGDCALPSLLRELRLLREERLRVVGDERECLRLLKREEIQACLQSIPGIGFRSAVVLQAELWDISRFKDKDALCSYVGLAPRLVGSGERAVVKSAGNRKKKELHYILIQAAWRSLMYNQEARARYGALCKKAGPQGAIAVIAKKMLLSIRAVWLQRREFIAAENKAERPRPDRQG